MKASPTIQNINKMKKISLNTQPYLNRRRFALQEIKYICEKLGITEEQYNLLSDEELNDLLSENENQPQEPENLENGKSTN